MMEDYHVYEQQNQLHDTSDYDVQDKKADNTVDVLIGWVYETDEKWGYITYVPKYSFSCDFCCITLIGWLGINFVCKPIFSCICHQPIFY